MFKEVIFSLLDIRWTKESVFVVEILAFVSTNDNSVMEEMIVQACTLTMNNSCVHGYLIQP